LIIHLIKANTKRNFEFVAVAKRYIAEQIKEGEETKLFHSIKKVLPRVEEAIKKYWDLQEDINIQFANTDVNGSILFTVNANGSRQYQFTKADIKERDKQSKTLLDEFEFDIQEHICAEIPANFNPELIPFLQGFVIKN
jgi:hypothetical protein